jgi:SAM-dependent methyltransferase
MTATTERFTDRVAHYIKWRPNYPHALYAALVEQEVVQPGAVVADIGAGTGISAALFAEQVHTVFAVEPNAPMREAGAALFAQEPRITWHNGTAEATGLEAASVDVVVAAQAFHWFRAEETRAEFNRILRPGGQVLLLWNDRITKGDGFSEAYEEALRYFAIDYAKVDHKQISTPVFDAFWGVGNWRTTSVPNVQELTFEGLLGRVLSSSYMPQENHPEFPFLQNVLKKIFLRYQQNGTVTMRYTTRAFYGPLS